jgi:hypothetical protein
VVACALAIQKTVLQRELKSAPYPVDRAPRNC